MSDTMPVRCFTCNKVVGNKWGPYLAKILEGKTEGQALTELSLSRPCCRRMILSHVPRPEEPVRVPSTAPRVQ